MKDIKERIPKTQKQWLHFALKVQAKINKIYKQYAKDITIEDWYKKVKGVKPKYYSVDVERRFIKEEISAKPEGQRSFAVVYEKEGLRIQRSCYGIDEGDIRDRGNFYTVSTDGITISYHNGFISRPFKYVWFSGIDTTIKVNGIEVEAKIDGWFNNQKEFRFEVDNRLYKGTINGQMISVELIMKNNGFGNRPLDLLKCMKKKPQLGVAEKAAFELVSEFGIKPIGLQLKDDGYRYREDIEADPE